MKVSNFKLKTDKEAGRDRAEPARRDSQFRGSNRTSHGIFLFSIELSVHLLSGEKTQHGNFALFCFIICKYEIEHGNKIIKDLSIYKHAYDEIYSSFSQMSDGQVDTIATHASRKVNAHCAVYMCCVPGHLCISPVCRIKCPTTF